MGVTNRQGPVYFHAKTNKKFRDEYDRIFKKTKTNKPESNKKSK